VGAINTFNTPNGPVASNQTAITGRSLHAVTETGETGWVQIQANLFQPVSTSNTAVPASSPDCSTFGLPGGHQCLLLNIDGHTGGGATGYEPYFASQQFQFTGAPGELRVTQVGDTACMAASSVSNCNWTAQHELLTLAIKNYKGTDGAWVFQRGSYGPHLSAAGPPITLLWQSIQSSMPPGATSANLSLTAYWSPMAGCAGQPDPHGDCLMQDTNNTSGHGAWRDGGEAVATNVPAWAQPIWGWPTDYQTAVGAVPGIFSLPFANVTPRRASGVNYTSTNPPFAKVFGHPWGFDAGSHPNAAGALASPNEAIRAFDNMPLQGGGGDPQFTRVTDQLFVATPANVTDPDDFFGSGREVPINRKLMAQGNSCGSHPLIDISGPTSSISRSTSGSYTACFARANGECYAGSTTGQVYVNCPGVIWPYCTGSGIHGGTPLGAGNDICVGNISASANAIRQFTLDQTDYAGAYTRTLVTATSRLRMVYGFENNRLLPDNSWLLFRTDWLDYQRNEMWMAKMLPYPTPDGINRGTFIPMAVNVTVPTGTGITNAIVAFGYGEFGAPEALNCTSRHDACIATASTVPSGTQPFAFASENPRGAPCVSTCTISIPAISQRVLYYQIEYLSDNNTVVSTSRVNAVTVP